MGGFFDYIPGNSLLHRLNPMTKLILSLMLCAACFVTERHLFCAGITVLNVAMAAAAGIVYRALRMLKVLIKFCLFLFILQVFFIRDGHVLLRLPLNIIITDRGLSFSLLMVLRLIGATLPLALMLSVTKMSDLSNVLVSKAHIPYKYAFALTTAMRFIPVFSAEMVEIMEAQTARGVEFDTGNLFKKVRLIFPLCVPLLITSVRKTEGAAISAELRGFNCRTRGSGYKNYPFRTADVVILVLCVLLIAAGMIC
ncbi:MAG: energy-coupling factor transporter transmembrane protein EcfT [Synergistaceae bacterium]|nr:energy-coupling factor transporter transmembrane protein EcfT [Synergistaceae bacterium]